MIKMTLTVDGMACSMCESHVNETVRRAFDVRSVTSSHKKNRTEIIAEAAPDEQKLRDAIAATGYTVGEITVEPYEKKRGLFGRK